MRKHHTSILCLVVVYALTGLTNECQAQAPTPRDKLINKPNSMWVAGRQNGNPVPNTPYFATVLHITEKAGTTDEVQANMWVYEPRNATQEEYTEDHQLTKNPSTGAVTQLTGEVGINGARSTATLTGTVYLKDGTEKCIVVWLTHINSRKGGGGGANRPKHVICRYKITDCTLAKTPGKKEFHPCEDVPTDDILEEEMIDPNAGMDPDYIP